MRLSHLFTAAVAMIILAGCGGGGGSSPATTGGDAGAVRLFATDDMSTSFDHVWVNVKKVVLVGASGDRILFEDATGTTIDLKTLRDANGRRFRLLSNRSVSSGNYSGIRVVVDSGLNVFPTGATTGTAATFDGAEGATKTLSLDFASPRQLGGGSNLIVDFDLSRWTLNGSVISATDGQFLNVVEDNGVHDIGRHNLDDYKGTVGGLNGTAPDQTFTLSRGGSTVTVKTDANTAVFNENGAASPTLSNGERVEVTGVFSTADNSLLATSIKIDDPQHEDENEIRGQITSFSSASGTITVNVFRTEGFIPTSTALTIQVGSTTGFFSDRGVTLTVDEFWAGVANDGFIEAEGTVNGDVLTATKVKLEAEGEEHHGGHGGGGGHHGGAELTGTTSAIDATAGTFNLTVTRWEGLLLTAGAQVQVKTSANTEFKVNGSEVGSSAFFAALSATANTSVEVEGTYDAATKTLTATEIKVGGDGGGHHGGGDD